jgi:hypothetical protein
MEVLFDLIAWPVVGLFQATVGILWPSSEFRIRRLQRITAFITILVLSCIVIGSLLWQFLSTAQLAVLFSAAYLCFLGAGALGSRIEKNCRRDK